MGIEIRNELMVVLLALEDPYRDAVKNLVECCFQEAYLTGALVCRPREQVFINTDVALLQLVNVLRYETTKGE